MRLLLASTALALLIGLSPASAMCNSGGGQQAGMCGAPAASKNMSEWPMAQEGSAGTAESGMGMCPCRRNMATMDGMKSDDPRRGMDMQKQ